MRESHGDQVWVWETSEGELATLDWLGGLWKRWIVPTRENRGMIWGMGVLGQGETADWHSHSEPELFYVLEGEGEAGWGTVGSEHTTGLHPGVAFYKPGGIRHRIRQTGDRPLKGLVFKIGDAQ